MASIQAGRYQHYKGQYYQVLDIAQHTETAQLVVVYRALYGARGLWVRPYEMFIETVDLNGEKRPRFKYIDAGVGD